MADHGKPSDNPDSQTQEIPIQPFASARCFAISLGLTNRAQWRQYVRGEFEGFPQIPAEIPKHPDRTYQEQGWEGWKHWLGTEMQHMQAHEQDAH
ncbi:MAG: hypothetical protein OXT67_00715 [Zetaproteobacteria bacterium]|nr:hypothetical protein [Zetaproteobacteria bacterium]